MNNLKSFNNKWFLIIILLFLTFLIKYIFINFNNNNYDSIYLLGYEFVDSLIFLTKKSFIVIASQKKF